MGTALHCWPRWPGWCVRSAAATICRLPRYGAGANSTRAMTTWPDFRGNSSRRCWLAERRDVGTDYNAVTRRGYARSIHLVSLRLYSFVPKTLVPLRKKIAALAFDTY